MKSAIVSNLRPEFEPVAVVWSNTIPADALQFKNGKFGCTLYLFAEASRRGKIAGGSRESITCNGGRAALGFGTDLDASDELLDHYSAVFSKGLRSANNRAAYQAQMETAPKNWRNLIEYGERRHCSAELNEAACAAEKNIQNLYTPLLTVQFRAVITRKEYTMDPKETKRFEKLYQRHLRMLKLQGKSEKTRDAYARAIRRLRDHFDCCPDKITLKQFESYFAQLVDTHSWSTVKVDCWGIKFFWQFVLQKEWQWIHIVKPPKIKSLPDILTPSEIERLIGKTRKLRYRVFLLTTYSMGLRLSETLSLQVGDIDGKRKQVHIRRGKGHKDRFVPLPDLTLKGLRELWCKHNHPKLLFPNANGPLQRVKYAKNHMDRGGAQKAMKVVIHECGIKKKSPSIPCATALPRIFWNAA